MTGACHELSGFLCIAVLRIYSLLLPALTLDYAQFIPEFVSSQLFSCSF